jgi:hypothetical protein
MTVRLRLTVLVILALLASVVGASFTAIARADDVPADLAANGYIGLCNVQGQQVTGGSINDQPFIWTAIGSAAAPTAYQGTGQVATLFAFQPRPNVPADSWNGDTLTATSDYSTAKAPAAQATKLDFTLKNFLDEYPPQLNGLIQLRLMFGKAGLGTDPADYPVTWIRVSGDRWSVIQGGDIDCGSGKGVSHEIAAIGSKAAGLPSTASPTPGNGSLSQPPSSATTKSSPRSSGYGSSVTPTDDTSANQGVSTSSAANSSDAAQSNSLVGSSSTGPSSTSAPVAQSTSGTSGGSVGWIAVVAIVIVLFGGAFGWHRWWQRN